MLIEIDDWNQQRRSITSRDPKIIGEWFAEQANELINANAMLGPCQIHIWPTTPEELKAIGHQDLMAQFTQDGLLELAGHILNAAQMLAAKESARRAG